MREPKIGDRVKTKGYYHELDGQILTIYKISDNKFCYFEKEKN